MSDRSLELDRTELDRLVQQARQGMLVTKPPTPGIIRAGGADWLDLLDRIGTNSLKDLNPGQARITLLCNALGRVLDQIWILRLQEHGFLLTSATRLDTTLAWLQGYIFFRDDVRLERLEADLGLWCLLGPDAAAFGAATFPKALESGAGLETVFESGLAWEIEQPLPGLMMLVPGAADEPLRERLDEAGRWRQAWSYLRLLAGEVHLDSESLAECTPLELGLGRYVDFEKGCYIGQEVIARMESRGQVPRSLYHLELKDSVEPGQPITAAGRRVGTLLEVCPRPEGGYLGLALVQSWRGRGQAPDYQIGSSTIQILPLPAAGG